MYIHFDRRHLSLSEFNTSFFSKLLPMLVDVEKGRRKFIFGDWLAVNGSGFDKMCII